MANFQSVKSGMWDREVDAKLRQKGICECRFPSKQTSSILFQHNRWPGSISRPAFIWTLSVDQAYGRLNVFTRKTAIWARVTGCSGQ